MKIMQIKLSKVVLSMPYLFEASAFDANSEPKFSAHFIIEPGSVHEKAIKDALMKEATDLWKDKAAAKLKSIQAAGKIWCLRDGDSKLDKQGNPLAGYEGKLFVSAKNKNQPRVVGNGPLRQDPVGSRDGLMYSGAIVNAWINVKVNNQPSDQAYAYLEAVQFVAHGTPLAGGARVAAIDFEAIPNTDGAEAGASALFE